MKIIGYGICGPGEASRYLKATLDEFARLCDEVIILCNNTDRAEHDMIDSYGFKRVSDRREWGKFQWRIKQDFIERDIKQAAAVGDMLVCLDMDEVFDKELTKEWLMAAPLDAYHVFVVDLWNDPEHFKPESCFWNVRIWRWNGETKFKVKPVHCGLAPEWAYLYHRHAPFLLKHYGLMLAEDRQRKLARYAKYDPHAEHLDKKYYDMLKDDHARPFDEAKMHEEIAKEVASYNQTKPKESMNKKPKERYAYVKNPHGEVIDIPEKHLQMTLKRDPRFEFIGWADEQDKEIEELFEDTDVDGDDSTDAPASPAEHQGKNFLRSTADEKAELDALNAKDDLAIAGGGDEDTALLDEEDAELLGQDEPPAAALQKEDPHPKPNPNKAKAKVEKSKPAKKGGKKK